MARTRLPRAPRLELLPCHGAQYALAAFKLAFQLPAHVHIRNTGRNVDGFFVVGPQRVMEHVSADDSLTFVVSHYSIRPTAQG